MTQLERTSVCVREASPKDGPPGSLDWHESETGAAYVARLPESRFLALLLFFLSIFLDGFWLPHALSGGADALVVAVSLLLKALLGYDVLVGWLNTTVITIDEREFRITRGPIPQRGNVREALANIIEFTVTSWTDSENDSHSQIDLHTHHGTSQSLRALLQSDPEAADFVVRRLNEQLVRFQAKGIPYR